ncbi:ATP-binding protein [Pelagicoccus sp. SDUM812003]|uniref:ATP-binding protein n=1 Tax=Pelagicoccus sp. SDUM812003 TaxID=3041267 RepID=UPI00280DC7FF|nr:ATP-binding protein [Pelagicoccus sp. SDUM812003]MDQ8203910.1 ATP-binding protein [Pelagicoccus sp. SDUM812003]
MRQRSRTRHEGTHAPSHSDFLKSISELPLIEGFLEASPQPHLFLSNDGLVLHANAAYLQRLGLDRDAVLGKPLSRFDGASDSKERRKTPFLSTQDLPENAIVQRNESGELFVFEIQSSQIELAGQRAQSVFLHDITQRVRQDQLRKQLELQFNATARVGKIAYWEFDAIERIFTFNDHFYAIFGYTADEVGGYQMTPQQYAERFVHPEDQGLVAQEIAKAIESKHAGFLETIEHRIVYADGSSGYISVRIFLVKDEHGATVKTYGANQDITKYKEDERCLIRLNELLKAIRDTNQFINRAEDAQELARQATRNLMGERGFPYAWIALASEQDGSFQTIASQPESSPGPELLQSDGSLPGQEWLKRYQEQTHERRQAEGRAIRRLQDDDRKTLCIPLRHKERVFGFLFVVTTKWTQPNSIEEQLCAELGDDLAFAFHKLELDRKQRLATDEILQAKEAAEKAIKAKDEFLAVMSHEIRTPLNPILGYTHLLKISNPSETSLGYLESISRAAKQQLSLIDNILTFSRLDRGKITPNLQDFNPYRLCRDAYEDAVSSYPDLTLRFENGATGEALPEQLEANGDPCMLQEILDNLLNNACKYTEKGVVTLKTGYKRLADDRVLLRAVITDTGIGISPELKKKLFEPFTQEDTTYTREFGGAGIGLAIVKKLVQVLKGKIGVDSELGSGSRFWVEIPLSLSRFENKRAEIAKQPQKLDPSFIQGRRILIVEDTPENSDVTRLLLEGYGAEVSEVSNGLEAVKMCEKSTFDAILMDLAMPVMNGFEASSIIRNGYGPNARVPIITITADVSAEAQRQARKLNVQGHIVKPVDIWELLACLKRVLS